MIAVLLVLWSAMVHGSAAGTPTLRGGFASDPSNRTKHSDLLRIHRYGFTSDESGDHYGALTLDPGACHAWTYVAISQNIVGVYIKPTDFPAACTPEEHLYVTPHFYTVGDCPVGDCENDEGRLMTSSDLCFHVSDVLVPFKDNGHRGTKRFVVHKDGPICSEEEKALYAVRSFCPDPVEVYFKFDSELAEESCESPWSRALSIFAVVLGVIGTLILKCGCWKWRRAPEVAVVAVPAGFEMTQRHAPMPAEQPSERPSNGHKPAGSDSQDDAQAHSENVPLLTATLR